MRNIAALAVNTI